MTTTSLPLLLLLVICPFPSQGLYILNEYFMDPGISYSLLGASCGKTTQDDCLIVESHLRFLKIGNYPPNADCEFILDAGGQKGATYKFVWLRFEVEDSVGCSKDYVELYNGYNDSYSLIGRFCGHSFPDHGGLPNRRHTLIRWHSDDDNSNSGFRLQATRMEPAPCRDGYYLCEHENRCMDGRLYCDGIVQCDDGADEVGCQWWQVLLGAILTLGVGGSLFVLICVALGCTGVWVTVGALTCCRRYCRRKCCRCCRVCCVCCRDKEGDEDTWATVKSAPEVTASGDKTSKKSQEAAMVVTELDGEGEKGRRGSKNKRTTSLMDSSRSPPPPYSAVTPRHITVGVAASADTVNTVKGAEKGKGKDAKKEDNKGKSPSGEATAEDGKKSNKNTKGSVAFAVGTTAAVADANSTTKSNSKKEASSESKTTVGGKAVVVAAAARPDADDGKDKKRRSEVQTTADNTPGKVAAASKIDTGNLSEKKKSDVKTTADSTPGKVVAASKTDTGNTHEKKKSDVKTTADNTPVKVVAVSKINTGNAGKNTNSEGKTTAHAASSKSEEAAKVDTGNGSEKKSDVKTTADGVPVKVVAASKIDTGSTVKKKKSDPQTTANNTPTAVTAASKIDTGNASEKKAKADGKTTGDKKQGQEEAASKAEKRERKEAKTTADATPVKVVAASKIDTGNAGKEKKKKKGKAGEEGDKAGGQDADPTAEEGNDKKVKKKVKKTEGKEGGDKKGKQPTITHHVMTGPQTSPGIPSVE